MINQEIFKLLQVRLDLKQAQTYHHINYVRNKIGTAYSKETAAYFLASSLGIDIKKHLSEEALEPVRRLGRSHNVVVIEIPSKSKKKQKTTRIYRFKDSFEFECKHMPTSVMNEAISMADIYPYFYVFENSIRYLVMKTLEMEYGKDWWNTRVKKRIREKVQDRINDEENNPWHGKRGQHPIFYTDISHLLSIIRNNEEHIKTYLPEGRITWLTEKIQDWEKSRNIIAHNNPLQDHDIERVKLNFEDWIRQLSD